MIPGTAGYGSPYLLQNFGVDANALDKTGDKQTENSEFKKALALPCDMCYYNQAVKKQHL